MKRLSLDVPKQSRNREVKACLPCRNAKIKCDQAKPCCQKCLTNSRKCVYVARIRKDGDTATSDTGKTSPVHTSLLNNAKSDEQTIWPDQVGHLAADDSAQIRYYASSSWMVALQDIEGSPISNSSLAPDCDTPSSLPHLCCVPDKNLETPVGELYDFVHLPEVNRLICWYSEFVQFWHPVADRPTIVSAIQRLRRGQSCPAGSSALLAAICYSASSSLQASCQLESSSLEPSAWKELAEQLLITAQYPRRPNLNTLRAAFLLAAPSMAEWDADPNPGPISILVRAAQSLGLHRDPVSFHLSREEAESHRILWWSIQHLDVGYSFSHALPPLIHSTTSDVKVISGVRQLETRLLETQIRCTLLSNRIAEELYSVRKPTEGPVRRLMEDVERVCDYILSERQQSPSTDLERFISLCERLLCYKVTFILHQPYLRSAKWPQSSREVALAACHSYVKEFMAAYNDPSLMPFRWLLNHHNVYHASAIILNDLIQYPFSAESVALLATIDPTIKHLSQKSFRPCPPCKKLWLLLLRACELNQWNAVAKVQDIDSRLFDASIADWDPIFASAPWDDLSSVFVPV